MHYWIDYYFTLYERKDRCSLKLLKEIAAGDPEEKVRIKAKQVLAVKR
ncbi:MAG: hypothetical protein GY757_48820 [bacterium]|nr:hypothetical protein [bacterium]